MFVRSFRPSHLGPRASSRLVVGLPRHVADAMLEQHSSRYGFGGVVAMPTQQELDEARDVSERMKAHAAQWKARADLAALDAAIADAIADAVTSRASTDHATAYHEAGHAVVAVELGGEVSRVTARPSGRRDGEIFLSRHPADAKARIAFMLAGPVAERLARGERAEKVSDMVGHYYAEDDLREARQTAAQAGCPATDATLQAALDVAYNTLRERWGDVTALARRLMVEPELSGQQVTACLAEA